MKKQHITKEEIDLLLESANEELKSINKNGEIVCCGGTALILMFDARKNTKDIDAIFEPKQEFEIIIKKLSDKYDVPEDWLNDCAKVFFTREMKTKIYKKYSNLLVKCFDEESLLALKITSARELTNDANDAVTLMKALDIKTIEEVYDIVEKYIPKIRRTPKSYYFAQEVFERYKIIKEKESDKNE